MFPLLHALALVSTSAIPAPTTTVETPLISWFEGSFEAALERARSEHKPVVLYFWMDGSENCARLYEETIQSPAVGSSLSQAVCFSVPHADAARYPLFERFHVGTVPALIVLTPDGQADDGLTGHAAPDYFLSELSRMFEQRNTVSDLEARLQAVEPGSPEGLELAWRLADRLSLLGAQERAAELLEHVRRSDPKGKTRAGAELLLADAQESAFAGVQTDGDMPSLGAVSELAQKSKVPEVRHKAWSWLVSVHEQQGDRTAAMKALQNAWKDVPEDEATEWGASMLSYCLEGGLDERTSQERKFLLELARSVVKRTEAIDREGTWWRQRHPLMAFDQYLGWRVNLLAEACAANGKDREAELARTRAHELCPELAAACADKPSGERAD